MENLNAGHFNCQSLTANFGDVYNAIKNYNLDILGISESFLKDHIADNRVKIDGFNLYRKDRMGKECGGVAIYIRDDLNVKILDSSSKQYSGKPEHILVEIKPVNQAAFMVGVVYRPPKKVYPFEFWEILGKHSPLYKNVLVMGDLNIDLNHKNTDDSKHLRRELSNLGLSVIPFDSTHHTASSHTWIDHIFVNELENIEETRQMSFSPIGHDLIVIK